MKKVGLYFGSFNPVHNFHVDIVHEILQKTKLEEIWLIVSPHNPHKLKSDLIEFNHRLKMVELAFENDSDKIKISDIESILKKPSYTVDTLNALEMIHICHNIEFSIIFGSDCLNNFTFWKNYEYILKNYDIFIYPRGDEKFELLGERMFILKDVKQSSISSTLVREKLKNKKVEDVINLIPNKVFYYIIQNKLYDYEL